MSAENQALSAPFIPDGDFPRPRDMAVFVLDGLIGWYEKKAVNNPVAADKIKAFDVLRFCATRNRLSDLDPIFQTEKILLLDEWDCLSDQLKSTMQNDENQRLILHQLNQMKHTYTEAEIEYNPELRDFIALKKDAWWNTPTGRLTSHLDQISTVIYDIDRMVQIQTLWESH